MSDDIEPDVMYRARYLMAQGASRDDAIARARAEALAIEMAPLARANAEKAAKRARYRQAAARAAHERPRLTQNYRR